MSLQARSFNFEENHIANVATSKEKLNKNFFPSNMSTFFLFSPEQSEIDTVEETPTELTGRPSLNFDETITPQPVQKRQNQPVLLKHKRISSKAHPTYAVMVDEAVYNMGVPRKGLSLFAVKKFLQEKYELDMKYADRRIKKIIKDALENGRYVKTTGRGLNGSFRLASNTRQSLNNKYAKPPKSLRYNLRTSHESKRRRKVSTKIKEKANNIVNKTSNQKNSELLKNNRKRKASPIDAPRVEEIKKARKGGPAIMRARD